MTAIRLHIGDFVTSKIDDEHVEIVTKTFDSTGITTKVKVSPIDALGVMEDKECRTSAWNRTPDDRKEKCIKSMIRNRKLFVESMCEVEKLLVSLKTNRKKNDEFAEQISNLKDEIHRCNEKYQRTKQLEREDSPLYKIGEIVMHANTQTMYTVKNIQKDNIYLYMYELALPIKASDISSTNDLFQIVSESEITHTTKNQKRTYVGLSHYWYQEAMRQHEIISALNRNEKSLSCNLASAKKDVEALIAEKDKLIGQTKSQDITISCQANELSENYKEIDRLTKKCQDIRHELFTLQAHEYKITQDLKNKIMENYNTRGYIHYAEYISRHFLVSILQFLHIVKTYDRYSDISFPIKLSPDDKDIQGIFRPNPDNQETEEINKSERNDKDGSEIQ